MSPNPAFRSLLLLALAEAASVSAHAAQPVQPLPEPILGTLVSPAAHCPEDAHRGSYLAFSPVHPIDSVQLNRITHDRPSGRSSQGLTDENGEVCSGASNAASCERKLSKLKPSRSLFYTKSSARSSTDLWLTWTSGDEVGLIDDPAALKAWLGTIDTPGEAMALVHTDGSGPICATTEADGSYTVISTRSYDCPMKTVRLTKRVHPDGTIEEVDSTVIGGSGACVGRLTEGARMKEAGEGLGARLARDARIEGIAALAFERLAEELTAHGAPPDLIAGARQAAAEERSHAALVTALATAHGIDVDAPTLAPSPVRTLETIALENAAEGCCREVLGATVGLLQAQQAEDAGVRAAMAQIAPEEVRHAEWSLALDAWLMSQLSKPAQERVAEAKRTAWQTLAADIRTPAPEVVRRQMGLPTPAQAAAMLTALSAG